MNTNHSNDSFQSVRVFCSKAKTRLLLIAFLLCLSGPTWAQSLSVDLTMQDVLIRFKGSLAPHPDSTPVGPPIVAGKPAAKPGPTPLGPPITSNGLKPRLQPWQTDPPISDPVNGRR